MLRGILREMPVGHNGEKEQEQQGGPSECDIGLTSVKRDGNKDYLVESTSN